VTGVQTCALPIFPVSDSKAVDFAYHPPGSGKVEWSQAIKQAFTQNGKTYAFGIGMGRMSYPMVVYFNKRLFREAGLDPNLPYDLQKSGEWTWDKFLEICERLTRDIDNDGITDTYAITGFEADSIAGLIFSNNGKYIGRDSDGKFYNAMSEPNFIEGIQFAKDLVARGFWVPAPDGAEWDWGRTTAFHDAHAAMIFQEVYSTGSWEDMSDDWGLVFVPRGPRASEYHTYISENVYVIPFNLAKEDAEDIMFAFDLYTDPLPYDIEYPDYWKDGGWGYSRFRDTRAVDETL
jgi:ABC-type glycerol-3-phosphate transport system substrate-binding protein